MAVGAVEFSRFTGGASLTGEISSLVSAVGCDVSFIAISSDDTYPKSANRVLCPG